ncbi:MAG: carboxypeptidase regulatory-like domain-containing protein [Candidatus Acidiferrales bacterium]
MSVTRSLFLVLVVCLALPSAFAQSGNSSSISGTVLDPSGATVANAVVTIRNSVSQFERSATSDATGKFSFSNVPFNPYHMSVTATGFAPFAEDVEVRSSVPTEVKVSLELAGSMTTVTVEGGEDLVENDSTFHTDVDRALFEKLPLESSSSSVSSLVTLSTPGVAADSNGLFHGLGDHAENSFSVDGQAITDQQSKVFSNQIPLDSIQSLEVISGAPPAEFGDKTSLVIKVTTRSGQGVTTPHGSFTTSYGSFSSPEAGFDLAYGNQKIGNFIALSGLDSGRFLDPPEFKVMHDNGNEENLFDRVDYQLSTNNSIHLNLGYTRSWFQTPNSYDAENATPWSGVVVNNAGLDPDGVVVGPADQRSEIGTYNIAPTFTRLINASTVFNLGFFVRRDQFNYYPSDNPFADLGPADLQAETAGQNRSLMNTGVRSDLSYVKGIHNIKVGATYEQTFLNEQDTLGIVNPLLNAVCLNADQTPDTNPSVTNPVQCGSFANPGGSVNPAFVPLLGCYDLTRTAGLPLSDGCPGGQTTSSTYLFSGHTDVKELALYVQDSITKGNWTANVGIRGDLYNGLAVARQAEPRVGVAYNFKRTNTVIRASYARTMETPFNENLILSSEGCLNPAIGALFLAAGEGCTTGTATPLSPGTRNEFHAGLQQAFGKYLVLDGEYITKYTNRAFDFSVLGATPITFPIEWNKSKIPGYAIRASVPEFHGLTALVVMSSVAARFFTPQIGGVGSVPAAVGPFRIDHDEKFNQTSHIQYQPWKTGPWFGVNWRYDSGLVAGSVPCAGGDCANGPQGSDTVVDASILSPDQQYQAGLFCGSTYATPTTPISPNSVCPASEYGSKYLKIPAPGTENNDHNPPRVAPRSLFDLAVGDDNLFRGDRFKWSARLTAINVANKEALYNFLSTFSGTHYVTPRTLTGEIGFHF